LHWHPADIHADLFHLGLWGRQRDALMILMEQHRLQIAVSFTARNPVAASDNRRCTGTGYQDRSSY
jgi:hypothetical protein